MDWRLKGTVTKSIKLINRLQTAIFTFYLFEKFTGRNQLRAFTMLTLLICFTAGGVAAEVSVKTYQSSNEGRLSKNQHARALKEYSKLPGTTLIGPKKSFTVRKIVYNTTPVSTMIATNTGGQNMRQIGRAIIEQTDCQIAQGTRVELITSFSGSGFAFFCSP